MASKAPQKQHESHPGGGDSAVPDTEASPANSSVTTDAVLTTNSPEKSSKRSSWYTRTWPRKPPPVTNVAREGISSASNTALEVFSSIKQSTKPKAKRTPSIQLTLGKAKSSRSQPADATTTRVNAVSTGSVPLPSKTELQSTVELHAENYDAKDPKPKQPITDIGNKSSFMNLEPPEPDGSKTEKPTLTEENPATKNANGGPSWLDWFSRPPTEPRKESNSAPPSLRSAEPPLPPQETPRLPEAVEVDINGLPPVPADFRSVSSKRSWLPMWNGVSTKVERSNTDETETDAKDKQSGEALATAPSDPAAPSAPPTLPGDGSRSGWVFWSRDPRPDGASPLSGEPHVGEIAVLDTPSQKRPRRTSLTLDDRKSACSSEELHTPIGKSPKGYKAKGVATLQSKDKEPPSPAQNSTEARKARIVDPTTTTLPAQDAAASKQLHDSARNLLLPSFDETFTFQEPPSMFQMLSRLFYHNKFPEDKHLQRVKVVPRLKSALAIGVHGYFPAPLIRTVLGQPTGTSIKFADMAAKAIRKWTDSRGYDCEVKTAALEGEGRISERVELLWKLLLNWIDEIRKADFVMIACHSQGVPVAMMLVAKLVDFGCVHTARVGVCAMAGVSLGPFADYKSRWISGSAGELFEFSDSTSTVSKDYLAAIETVLKFGVRLTYVGSIDDQLVSLESSAFSPISHPHIYRAVFVDGRIHAPNFLVHLVGFALKLRNLGVQDHGLIRELSGPLAGSLYSGEGHSRIYEENAVYDLAVQFALETNAILNAPLSQKPSPTPSSNPYILPWAVRGILEEDFVKSDLRDEANDLLKQFDEWKPTTKVLKDVKFRLEGIRSKL